MREEKRVIHLFNAHHANDDRKKKLDQNRYKSQFNIEILSFLLLHLVFFSLPFVSTGVYVHNFVLLRAISVKVESDVDHEKKDGDILQD